MDSGILLIIALIIIGFAITWSNQGQVKEVESRQSEFAKRRNEIADHDNRSEIEVDKQRNEMLKTLDDSIKDNPEQLDKIKHIINDWADMKIKSFKNRRSWVRNPDEDHLEYYSLKIILLGPFPFSQVSNFFIILLKISSCTNCSSHFDKLINISLNLFISTLANCRIKGSKAISPKEI